MENCSNVFCATHSWRDSVLAGHLEGGCLSADGPKKAKFQCFLLMTDCHNASIKSYHNPTQVQGHDPCSVHSWAWEKRLAKGSVTVELCPPASCSAACAKTCHNFKWKPACSTPICILSPPSSNEGTCLSYQLLMLSLTWSIFSCFQKELRKLNTLRKHLLDTLCSIHLSWIHHFGKKRDR